MLEPLLPVHANTHQFSSGRPRVSDRRCANAISYVLRTGCHRAALHETDLCPKSTAYDRFRERVAAGMFLNLWQVSVEPLDELKGIDWDWLRMDGTMTMAPPGEQTVPIRPTAGKRASMRSLLTEKVGVSISAVIDGANRYDMKLMRATIEGVVVARPAPMEVGDVLGQRL